MPFTLEVDFSGLCLYVHDPDSGRAAVLMPDCRKRTDPNAYHEDETRGVPHVGYVRINLADLGIPLTPPATTTDPAGEPRYELVHRFDQQLLQFVGDAATGPVNHGGGHPVPDFKQIAPSLKLIDGLFTDTPPAILLMRTILDGGTLVGKSLSNDPPIWTFSRLFNPDPA